MKKDEKRELYPDDQEWPKATVALANAMILFLLAGSVAFGLILLSMIVGGL